MCKFWILAKSGGQNQNTHLFFPFGINNGAFPDWWQVLLIAIFLGSLRTRITDVINPVLCEYNSCSIYKHTMRLHVLNKNQLSLQLKLSDGKLTLISKLTLFHSSEPKVGI